MRPNEMLALKWVNVDLTHLKMISVKEGRVQGIEGPPKTDSSYRDIDILPPLLEVLKRHRDVSPPGAFHSLSKFNVLFLSEKTLLALT